MKYYDDRTFAIRLRFAIPEHGLKCAMEMNAWLRDRTNGQYATHGASSHTYGQQCCYLYVNDPVVALDCVNAFGLEVWGL